MQGSLKNKCLVLNSNKNHLSAQNICLSVSEVFAMQSTQFEKMKCYKM